jgi:hypothetical protein
LGELIKLDFGILRIFEIFIAADLEELEGYWEMNKSHEKLIISIDRQSFEMGKKQIEQFSRFFFRFPVLSETRSLAQVTQIDYYVWTII